MQVHKSKSDRRETISKSHWHACTHAPIIHLFRDLSRGPVGLSTMLGVCNSRSGKGGTFWGKTSENWAMSTLFSCTLKKKKKNRWSLSIIQSVISGDFLSQLVLLETEKLAHWVENRFSSMEVRSGFQLLSIYLNKVFGFADLFQQADIKCLLRTHIMHLFSRISQ